MKILITGACGHIGSYLSENVYTTLYNEYKGRCNFSSRTVRTDGSGNPMKTEISGNYYDLLLYLLKGYKYTNLFHINYKKYF